MVASPLGLLREKIAASRSGNLSVMVLTPVRLFPSTQRPRPEEFSFLLVVPAATRRKTKSTLLETTSLNSSSWLPSNMMLSQGVMGCDVRRRRDDESKVIIAS